MVAIFAGSSKNVKLAGRGQVAATYLATEVSCPSTCALRGSGCYAEYGNVGLHNTRLNSRIPKGMRPEAAAREERNAIRAGYKGRQVPQDGVTGGRDLRMHVTGDARTRRAANILAQAAEEWNARGGGRVWSYTHAWKTVKRSDWGRVSVLASMENPADSAAARERGFAPALVVDKHTTDKAFTLPGSDVKWIPCPAQTRDVPCSDCGLCMNANRLFDQGKGIAFEAHGPGTKKARVQLRVL